MKQDVCHVTNIICNQLHQTVVFHWTQIPVGIPLVERPALSSQYPQIYGS